MPTCTNCIQTTAAVSGFNPAGCTTLPSCYVDASCVVYTGPALNCSGILTYDPLDIILQKIDPLLCAATGDYSTYNTFCLSPISTQKQFVESISNFVCTLQTNFTTFTGTTFPAYQASVTAAINGVNNPGVTCTVASVTPSDNLPTILNKYCTILTNMSTNLALAGVTWSSCYTVSPIPATLSDAFNVIIGQICLLKSQVSAAAVLPIFNNTSNCLGGSSTDTLVTTIGLITTRLCNTGIIDNSAISWGCVTAPTGNQNLQDAIQNIVTQLNTVSRATPFQWSADFTVTNVDSGNTCLGKHIALATPSTQDRFVAATTSDSSPGTLQAKVTAGTNITLDFITTPGQMIINSTGGVGTGDHKVLIDGTDTTADYIGNKTISNPAILGVTVIPTIDMSTPANHKLALGVNIDPVTLFTALLQAVGTDAGLKTLFCSVVASCPSPCSAPSNVTVTYTSGTTSTTTTTTTTA